MSIDNLVVIAVLVGKLPKPLQPKARCIGMTMARGFLIMIGMALVAHGFGAHVSKAYIYPAMVCSVVIELIIMRQRRNAKPAHLRNPCGGESPEEGDERRALEEAGGRRHLLRFVRQRELTRERSHP